MNIDNENNPKVESNWKSHNRDDVDQNYDDMSTKDVDFDDKLLNSGLLKPASQKKKHLSFKEMWESVDEVCPTCGKVSKPAEGLTRQNIKKLVSFQTDVQSLTILSFY